MQRKGLGRGLDALISREALSRSQSVIQVGVNDLALNPYQPRTQMAQEGLEELAQSIRKHGIIQPLMVRPVADGYQLVAGERRLRAARLAGLESVPCVVRETSDEEAVVFALVENLQREDVNAIDAAQGYRRLLTEFHMTQSELAEQIGRSRAAIANTLRLLDLPADIQASISQGTISEGHGRALLLAGTEEGTLLRLWTRVRDHGLSVRETEELARRALGQEDRPKEPAAKRLRDANLVDVEERLQRALGTRVQIRPRGKRGGAIVIRYRTLDELEALVAMAEREAQGHPQ
jgi:ParB family chromosome partitioning protein